LRGSEAKSDPRAQWDERRHVSRWYAPCAVPSDNWMSGPRSGPLTITRTLRPGGEPMPASRFRTAPPFRPLGRVHTTSGIALARSAPAGGAALERTL
jgi:hypothetical protein